MGRHAEMGGNGRPHVDERDLPGVTSMSVGDALAFFKALELPGLAALDTVRGLRRRRQAEEGSLRAQEDQGQVSRAGSSSLQRV